MITDPPKTLVSTPAVGVGSDVLFGLLRKMLNKHFTMAADEHREGASDSSVFRHAAEFDTAEAEFRAALTELQESAKTWQATADAHLDTLKTQREAMSELYAMAIEHCKYRGWSKHPTIDKAHALLWSNTRSQPHAEDKA